MSTKISYNTGYDPLTGEPSFLTECPHYANTMLASDACFQCQYFVSVTFAQQIECAIPAGGLLSGFGGFSERQTYNLSPEQGNALKTKIQSK